MSPEDDEQLDPLAESGAGLPPVLGAGCASRFDPDALDEEMGTDFATAAEWFSEQAPKPA